MIDSDNRLWAPWRMEYIERELRGDSEGCFLCKKLESKEDEKNLILMRGKTCFVVMNLYPYNNAHLMVCPYRHLSDYIDLTSSERSECQEVIAGCMKIIDHILNPDGYNVGLNLGKAAGAGLEEHIHWHIVPRWSGDTNFMPVLGQTKVMMEGLRDSFIKLLPGFSTFEKSMFGPK